MVNGEHVRRTLDACAAFLTSHFDADWSSPIPDLEGSVIQVVAHAAKGCLWYALDLAAVGADLEAIEHQVTATGEPAEVVAALRTQATVLAAVVDASPSTARGFHPLGAADPSGFAAMACDEMLIHTDDAARGLRLEFNPPPDLVEPVLRRLFPWVLGSDPWQQLRWANGRIALDGQPRLDGWAWHCAPLADWDGTIPSGPQST